MSAAAWLLVALAVGAVAGVLRGIAAGGPSAQRARDLAQAAREVEALRSYRRAWLAEGQGEG